jgi:hypothetical protein
MAFGQIRIGIPGNTSSNFSTATLAVLTLENATADAPLSLRSPIGFNTAGTPSNYGTTPITGPAYTPKELWTLAPLLTASEAMHLRALVTYQKSTGNPLRLIDEVDLIAIDPAYNNRTLLEQTTPSWGSGYRTGYGVFSVQLQLDGDWNQYFGIFNATGEQARVVTFTAVEL